MNPINRRTFLGTCVTGAIGTASPSLADFSSSRWRDLFDGKSLSGWEMVPRLSSHQVFKDAPADLTKEGITDLVQQWHKKNKTPQKVLEHTGKWTVKDGTIIGRQDPDGCRHGGYLRTEEQFGDFELEYEMRPDWPTDTGVILRQHDIGTIGFQVLCDHRKHGGIGGIFTNSLGGYLAAPFVVDGDAGRDFSVKNFRQGIRDTRHSQGRMDGAASFQAFKEVWNLNGWNRFRVRCVGTPPTITVWINDLQIGSLDTANPGVSEYNNAIIEQRTGTRGHIGLEVHSNTSPNDWSQWGIGAVSRWRNIRVREVTA